ncbi:MAG: exodeoxyribonuclease VII large subunit [Burkholderiaceae bacterium]
MVEASASAAPPSAWEVGALVRTVADAVAGRFAVCTVQGALSSYSRAASGHCYFTLKDAQGAAASIRCVLFRRAALLLDFSPADGQLVLLRGRLGVYESRGELQLVVESMRPAGAGALYERFVRLRQRLEGEGLFDADRKRALPPHPRRIGVVTSLAAAALRDVVTTLTRRAVHVGLVVYPSPVQGTEAARALAEAIAVAGRRDEVDVLILCRGGGSIEDLWSFNDEVLVRAIVASPIPVVCGVGHETDITLADLAADLRAATPTAAAELAAPATQDCLDDLAARAHALSRRLRRRLDADAQHLDATAAGLLRPAELLHRRHLGLDHRDQRLSRAGQAVLTARAARIEQLGARLHRAARVVMQTDGLRLAACAARLSSVDPARVLARGYAWLTDENGTPVASVRVLHPDDQLQAVLHDGSAQVRVVRVDAGSP